MANKSALFNIAVETYIPGTAVKQTAATPNSGVYAKLQKAGPFFGGNVLSGSTPTDAVQLWPVKL